MPTESYGNIGLTGTALRHGRCASLPQAPGTVLGAAGLAVMPGQLVAVAGQDEAGKSVLLKSWPHPGRRPGLDSEPAAAFRPAHPAGPPELHERCTGGTREVHNRRCRPAASRSPVAGTGSSSRSRT